MNKRDRIIMFLQNNPMKWYSAGEIAKNIAMGCATVRDVANILRCDCDIQCIEKMSSTSNPSRPSLRYRYNPGVEE